MRTWKWMLTASLLIALSAMAQQTTAPASSSDTPDAVGAALLEPGSGSGIAAAAHCQRSPSQRLQPAASCRAPPPWTRWLTAPLCANMR